MSYDNMLFLSPHALSVKDNCLVVDGGKERALEDINMMVIENRNISLSSYLLSELAKYNITCMFCDEKHMPSNILLPVSDNVRHVNRLQAQCNMKITAKKDLWKRIIERKIKNQAECLGLFGIKEADMLFQMSRLVKTNDNTYMEAEAARIYFPALYGEGFHRRDGIIVNAALNYGYSIIRSIIARSLVAYGFEPSVGIWHCNTYNCFNLADDFIEPYRPAVDHEVKEMMLKGELDEELTSENKQKLISLQNRHVIMCNNKMEIRDSINKMIMSYIICCERNSSDIHLPECIYE